MKKAILQITSVSTILYSKNDDLFKKRFHSAKINNSTHEIKKELLFTFEPFTLIYRDLPLIQNTTFAILPEDTLISQSAIKLMFKMLNKYCFYTIITVLLRNYYIYPNF